MPLDYLVSALVTLLVVVDPIGLVPTFLAVTHGLPQPARRQISVRAAIIAAAILTGTAFVGDWLLRQLGISLPHASSMQYLSAPKISREDLVPGDLVFFFPGVAGAPPGLPGHVGMYIGDDKFIQAPHTGDVVKISSLDDPSYALGYVGAVRPWGSQSGALTTTAVAPVPLP